MKNVKVGDEAPAFKLLSDEGREFSLDKPLSQKYLILYFYPADDTRHCTVEALNYRDAYSHIKDLGAEVVGISPDNLDSHKRFRQKYKLPFPLLSDPDKRVASLFGATWLFGTRTARTTLVLDQAGKVVMRFRAPAQPLEHVRRALNALESGPRP